MDKRYGLNASVRMHLLQERHANNGVGFGKRKEGAKERKVNI
jgi:hypothetical protein